MVKGYSIILIYLILFFCSCSHYNSDKIARFPALKGSRQCDIVIEENNPCIYYHGQKIKNIQAVIPRIGSSATAYGASVIRQFELMRVFTTLKADPLLKARDKISCMQILAANGLKVPKSTIFNNINSISYGFLKASSTEKIHIAFCKIKPYLKIHVPAFLVGIKNSWSSVVY